MFAAPSEQKTKFRSGLWASAAVIAMTGLAGPAGWAQNAAAQSVESSSDARIDTIIVTARKREESLQDVPISVTAIGSEAIDLLGANDLADVGLRAPNVLIDQNAGTGLTNLSIRGLSGPASLVGVYVDEFLINSGQGANIPLVDVQQVEVLRGPQGTLYGRNTMAGLINTIRRKPSDEFRAEAELVFGDFDLFGGEFVLGGELIEDFAQAKATYYYREREGFETNRINGEDINGDESEAIGLQLRLTPTDRLEVNLAYDDFEREGEGFGFEAAGSLANGIPQQLTAFGLPTPSYFDAVDMDGEDRVISADVSPGNTAISEISAIRARIDYDVGPFTISSLTQFGENNVDSDRDNDFTGENRFSRTRFDFDQEQFTQEIRLTSNGDGNVSWIVGGFYLDEEVDERSFETIFADFPVQVAPTGAPAPFPPAIIVSSGDITADLAGPGLLNLPDILTPDQAAATDATLLTNFSNRETEAYAAFGSVTWTVIPSLDLTVGGRWSSEDQSATQDKTSFLIDANGDQVADLGSVFFIGAVDPRLVEESFSGDLSDEDFSPTVSALWRATDNINLFASYARGFNSGGFNLSLSEAFADDRIFDSESVDNYDVGIRSTWLDGDLIVNATAYHLVYQDIQRFVAISTGIGATTNAAEAEGDGIEIEVAYRATRDLELFGALGVQETEFTDYNTNLFDPNAGADLSGNSPAFAPELTSALGFQYTRDVQNIGQFFFGSTWQYRDETFFTDQNLDDQTSPDANIVNANAGWRSAGGRYEISVRGTNLLDETYFTNFSPSIETGTNFVGLNPPRNWFVQLGAKY